MTDITETEVAPEAPEATEAPAPVARAPRGDRPIQTVGRRKEAIVRVRLVPGTGKITCNGRTSRRTSRARCTSSSSRTRWSPPRSPSSSTSSPTCVAAAPPARPARCGSRIARALIINEPDDRPALKKAGFLTRDARVKESKKYGLKKARKAPQYSKR